VLSRLKTVTYETIRRWNLKSLREFALCIRRRSPRRGDKWHLDEVVITIAGKKHWLWQAVKEDDLVPGIPVQGRRDKKGGQTLVAQIADKAGACASCADHR
jgi:putative transposase